MVSKLLLLHCNQEPLLLKILSIRAFHRLLLRWLATTMTMDETISKKTCTPICNPPTPHAPLPPPHGRLVFIHHFQYKTRRPSADTPRGSSIGDLAKCQPIRSESPGRRNILQTLASNTSPRLMVNFVAFVILANGF